MRVLASVLEDAVYIAQNLRYADSVEIEASRGGPKFVEALVDGFYASEQPMTFHVDGSPAAMFGVVPADLEGACRIWLLGTEDIEKASMYFLRNCRWWFERITEDYNFIFNFAHKDNELHLKWLRWMGFDIGEAQPDSDFVFVSFSPEDN